MISKDPTSTNSYSTPDSTDNRTAWQHMLRLPVIVYSLGYLVDMYYIYLFSRERIDSLSDIGYTVYLLMEYGVTLHDLQMGGLLVSVWFWGILGYKRGCLSVLLGSILIYSLANIANGFVQSF